MRDRGEISQTGARDTSASRPGADGHSVRFRSAPRPFVTVRRWRAESRRFRHRQRLEGSPGNGAPSAALARPPPAALQRRPPLALAATRSYRHALQAPADAFAGAQRHQPPVVERIAVRCCPWIAQQRDVVLVTWQAVEIGTVLAGKTLQPRQNALGLKHLGVQLDAGVGGEDAGAAAGGLLGRALVRGAVGAEEKPGIAAGQRFEQAATIGFGLEQRQAVVVRTQSAGEQRIAVQQQVLRRDGCRDAAACGAHEFDRRPGAYVLEHDPQARPALGQWRQYLLDEAGLALEYVDPRVSDLAVHQQWQIERRHSRKRWLEPCDLGHTGFRVGTRAGRIELAAEDRAAGVRSLDFRGAGG